MKKAVFYSLLLCLLLLIPYANGAKPYESPTGNGGIYFDGNSGVALVDEAIEFTQLENDSRIPKAKVTVEYNMKNMHNKNQEFNIFFVVPADENSGTKEMHKVVLNGKDITGLTAYEEMQLPENWSPSFPDGLTEPYSQKPFSGSIDTKGIMEGIRIPMSIKAGGNASLKVEYTCEGGYFKSDAFEHTIYSFVYYLTPAKFWEGEPRVRLGVSFSGNKRVRFYSNIPMRETSHGKYTAELQKLPDHEWVFTFVDSRGLLYGTNNSRTHTNTTICISIGLFAVSYIASKYFRRRLLLMAGYSAAVLYLYCFIGKIVDGYIGDMFLGFILFMVLALVVPSAYFFSSRRKVTKQY